jgi:hypothetical protein
MIKKTERPSPELAIDIAIQATKLFIALATSVLAFTVTFSKEINDGVIACSMKTSWFFLGASIIAGVFLLQKVIGELAINGHVSLYKRSIKIASVIQNVSFVAGVLWVAFFMLMK